MTLYIANTTKRDHHLNYRLPSRDGRDPQRLYSEVIPAGGQIKAPHDHKLDVDAIIKQIAIYGARTQNEAAASKGFTGLIYAHDKPVNIEAIAQGLSTVDTAAIERAQAKRTDAAIAADANIAKAAQERGAQVSGLVLDVKEEKKPGQRDEDLNRQTIVVERPGARARTKRA